MSLRDRVAIIGLGTTKFGDNFEMSLTDMMVEAAYEAYQDAGIRPEEIEAGWLGNCYPDDSAMDGHSGATVAEALGLFPRPMTRVASYCSSGMDALRNAAFSVAAGIYKTVLVMGVEKMREVPSRDSLLARHAGKTHPLIGKGRTMPGLFAMHARRYFLEYGYDQSILAAVAIKNHHNGSLNPKAHFRREINLEVYRKAPMVSEPLGLFDCCPTTDGAAAMIITTPEEAKRRGADYVLIKGIGLATGEGFHSYLFRQENNLLGLRATQDAGQMAYAEAGITDPVKEVDVVEMHDCFTITEVLNYEDLGFCARGTGGKFILEGRSSLEGDLPVNTSGGLKSCGHPIGATGVRMVGEVMNQIRGRAGKRQVADVHTGLAHTLGGPGSLACVVIVGR